MAEDDDEDDEDSVDDEVSLSDGPSRIIRTLVFDVDLSLQDGEVNGDVDSEEEEEEDEEDDGL